MGKFSPNGIMTSVRANVVGKPKTCVCVCVDLQIGSSLDLPKLHIWQTGSLPIPQSFGISMWKLESHHIATYLFSFSWSPDLFS